MLPIFTWFRQFWRTSNLSTIFWNFSPCFQDSFPICPLFVCSYGWWSPFWIMPLYLFHDLRRGFLFCLLYCSSYTEPSSYVNLLSLSLETSFCSCILPNSRRECALHPIPIVSSA